MHFIKSLFKIGILLENPIGYVTEAMFLTICCSLLLNSGLADTLYRDAVFGA